MVDVAVVPTEMACAGEFKTVTSWNVPDPLNLTIFVRCWQISNHACDELHEGMRLGDSAVRSLTVPVQWAVSLKTRRIVNDAIESLRDKSRTSSKDVRV